MGAPGAAEPAAGQQGRERDLGAQLGREGPTWPCDLGCGSVPFWASGLPRPGTVEPSEGPPLSHAHSHAPGALNWAQRGDWQS